VAPVPNPDFDAAEVAPWEIPDEDRRQPVYTTLALVEPETISWLWHGWLPLGKLAVLDGDPGVGKSTLTIDIAARVTTGSRMPDGSAPDLEGPFDVVLVSAEDGIADTLRPRADAAGADVGRVHMLYDVKAIDDKGHERIEPWSMPRDLDMLQRLVTKTGARLVVIDPLNAVLHSSVDSYRDQDIRGALKPLARLAEETGAAVVVIRHLTKGGGSKAIYRGGGSIGIIGAARLGLLVERDPDDESGKRLVLSSTKSNVAEIPTSLSYELVPADEDGCARVSWLGESHHTASSLLAEGAGADERSDQVEIADLLWEWTEEPGEVAIDEVRSRLRQASYDVGPKTLQRAAKRAGLVASKPKGVGGKRYYVRPDSSDTPPRPPGGCPHVQTDTTKGNAADIPSVDSGQEVSTLDEGMAHAELDPLFDDAVHPAVGDDPPPLSDEDFDRSLNEDDYGDDLTPRDPGVQPEKRPSWVNATTDVREVAFDCSPHNGARRDVTR
jgi:hypothetical protein